MGYARNVNSPSLLAYAMKILRHLDPATSRRKAWELDWNHPKISQNRIPELRVFFADDDRTWISTVRQFG